MADESFLPIAKFLGWKVSNDGKSVLIGFENPNGLEITLGLPPLALTEAIANLINATSAFPTAKGSEVATLAMQASRFHFLEDDSTGDYALILGLAEGGDLKFGFDRATAERLVERLNEVVLGVAGPQPSGTYRN